MGVYGSAPSSPDPAETAAAQTATNVSTAQANSYLGNINQVTPDGTLTYSYGNAHEITDPTSGAKYTIPETTVTTALSAQQQAIKNQEDGASLNLATLANTQSGKLNTLLGTPFDLSSAPAAGNTSSLTAPSYQSFATAPTLQSSVGNTGTIQNSIANAGNIQTSIGDVGNITDSYDINQDVSQYQDALMAKLQPSLTASRSALEQQLANQGLQPGSAAYDRALATATSQENDARYGAILNAGQEQTRLANLAQQQATFQNSAQQQAYNQAVGNAQLNNTAQAQQYSQNANDATFANSAQSQGYNQALQNTNLANSSAQQTFQNQNTSTAANNALQDQSFNSQQAIINAQNAARTQYLNEAYAARQEPINEINSLMNSAQLSTPNFVSTQGQSLPTVDYAGLVNQDYQNQLSAYNSSQSGIGALLGGVGSLFSLSDENAKKDIKKVAGLYEYRYKDDPKGSPKRIGVMAQEIQGIRPEAVREGADGYKRVNYGLLFSAGAHP